MKVGSKYKSIVYSSVVVSILFTGCSVTPQALDVGEIKKDVKESFNKLNKEVLPVTKAITLEEAIDRAVNHNLTKKVETLNAVLAKQKIDITTYEALPELTANAGYQARDNYAASASTSFNNGQPDPIGANPSYSVSQDKDTSTHGVAFSWNILDFGLSYVRAQQQSDRYLIAKEKERKAKHNIEHQVRDAYYKAVASDELLKRITPIMEETRKALEDSRNIGKLKIEKPIKALSYQRELLEVLRTLHTLEENLTKSKIQLSKLMGLRPGTKFELAEKIKGEYKLPTFDISIATLEELALENRPELQESRYKERISNKEVKKVMLELLPGINLDAGYSYSDNQYLLNDNWTSYGASVSWNLFKVFTVNQKSEMAETQVELAKQQKLAMAMAVLSQVHMSVVDYNLAKKQYHISEDYFKVAEEIYKIVESENVFDINGRLSLIKEKLNYLVSNLRLSSSYAKVQNAYGKVMASVGKNEVFEAKNTKVTEVKGVENIVKKQGMNKEKKALEESKYNALISTRIDVLNIPSYDGKTLETLDENQKVKVLNKIFTENGYWYELENGYVPENAIVKYSLEKYAVALKNSNIRKEGSTNSKIIGSLKAGEKILVEGKVLSSDRNWYKTPNGFIAEELLKVVDNKNDKAATLYGVALKNSNIRESSSLDSKILDLLEVGEKIIVEKKVYTNNGTWYKTQKGYISEELLKIVLSK